LTLSEDIGAAFESWLGSLTDPPETIEDDAASTVVRFGDPTLFGPDTFSLTLQRSTDGSSVEVLFNPTGYQRRPTSLLHEAGILLGLGTSSTGVMKAALGAESPTAPSAEDIEALNSLRTFPPEDLTRDGVVDFYDLAAFAEQYGRQGVNLPADFDKDGLVDESDLDILRSAYTFTPPSPTPPGSSPPDSSPSQEPVAEEAPESAEEDGQRTGVETGEGSPEGSSEDSSDPLEEDTQSEPEADQESSQGDQAAPEAADEEPSGENEEGEDGESGEGE
jgi:hypothetical protein